MLRKCLFKVSVNRKFVVDKLYSERVFRVFIFTFLKVPKIVSVNDVVMKNEVLPTSVLL